MFDHLTVGAGFAGSVLAERSASDMGLRVLIVEKRSHIGGNAYGCCNDVGTLVHKYDPHVVHANATGIVAYLVRSTEWHPYRHRVLAPVDGHQVPLPINAAAINQHYGPELTWFQPEECFASVAEPCAALRTSEDVVAGKVGRELYEKFLRGYRRTQWCRTRWPWTPTSPHEYPRARIGIAITWTPIP